MLTDCEWVCSRCLDYRVRCQLCFEEPESLIPTPQWIKDKEKQLSRKFSRTRSW